MEGEEDERYYIASEIRSILSTGNVTSAGHRYELLEGDMTWEGIYLMPYGDFGLGVSLVTTV